MKKIAVTLLSILSSLTLHADSQLDILIESHQEMSFEVFRSFEQTSVVYSPYSLFNCLSMVYQGAQGSTKEAMEQALHLTISKEFIPSVVKSWRETLENTSNLTIANGMWVENNFQVLPEFTNVIEQDYRAKIESVDFSHPESTTSQINSWVAEKTHNTITNFLAPSDLTPMTRLVLVNTVYVNQDWKVPFTRTNEGLFWSSETTCTSESMMQKEETCPYYSNMLFQMAMIPTKDDHISCVVMLPQPKVSLADIEKDLSSDFFKKSLRSLIPAHLDLTIPKFSLTQKIDLSPILQKLGMGVAFSEEADLSGINGAHNLCIEKVLQQVVFAFSEKGIKAAAATGVSIGITSIYQPEPSNAIPFVADHPFLFFLIDNKSETILFAGKYQGSPDQ